MITYLTKIAIKRPVLTLMFYAFVIITGIISYNKLPVQLFPNLIYPELYVICTYPGASPEEIENKTVIPVEAEISRLKDIKEIKSRIYSNYGIISISYNFDTDMKFADLKLQQVLNKVKETLPEEASIVSRKIDTSEFSSWMMELTVLREGETDYIKKIIEEKAVPELSSVDGVIDVSVSGGKNSEVQIIADKNKLESLKMNLTTIVSAVNNFNKEKEYIGKVYSKSNSYFVSLEGEVTGLHQLENIVVEPSKNVKLSNVANLKKIKEAGDVRYRVNGKSTLGMTVIKESKANLLDVSEALKDKIDELNNDLRNDGIEIKIKFNQASMLDDALSEIKKLALYGVILAFFILLLFLKDIKIVSVIIFAIPISVIFTFNIMYFSGVTLNILSFCGLALALGMLVDNGIVVLENIFRHSGMNETAFEACINGTNEVKKSISASTLTTIAVFLPSIFVQNELRIILKEFALSIINPLAVSLLVSFTLIPMFSYQVLKRKRKYSNKFYGKRKGRAFYSYMFLLVTAIRNRGKFIFGIVLIFLVTLIATLPFILTDTETERNYQFSIYVDTPLESNIEATDRVVKNVENELKAIEHIEEVRSIIRENEAVITVEFDREMVYKNKINIESIKEELKKKTDIISGGIISYDRNIGPGQRGDEGDAGSGVAGFLGFSSEPEKIKLRGYDLEKLKVIADKIKNSLEDMDEVEEVNYDFRRESPEIRLIGKQDRLSYYNLTMFDIMRLLWITRQEGISSGTEFKYRDYTIPIKIYLNKKEDRKISNIKHLKIPVSNAENVPISFLTDIYIDEGPKIIKRRNQRREIEITYSLKKEIMKYEPVLKDTRKAIDDAVRKIYLPKGFTIEIEHDTSNNSTLYWILGISAILIFMILASVFESLVTPFIIFITIPLATIGVFWILLITSTGLNEMALLGMLILLGIIVNNGIILIDYANYLRNEKGYRKIRAIVYSGIARLRPILMTAGTTVLGILPLAFKTNKPDQIWPPFAIAVLGGLAFGTLFTTVILPIMYITSEEIVENFKKINVKLLPFLLFLLVVSYLLVDFWISSILWKIIFVILMLILSSWFVMKLNKLIFGKSRIFLKLKDYTITLRNLTKIYNKPGKTRRDWDKYEKFGNLEKQSESEQMRRKNLKENLLWQIPIAAFLIYMHMYLSKPFWIFVITLVTYYYIVIIHNILKELLYIKAPIFSKYRKIGKILYFIMIVSIFMYLKIRWGSGFSLPIVGIILWFLIRHFRNITKNKQMYRKVIHQRKKIIRNFYKLVFKIPFFKPPKPEINALKHVNLKIEKGMFGLLGPNGAGKTTLMRLVCNIIDESYGSVYIGDINVKEIREAIQRRIGYLPQSFGLYENFSGYQYLNLIAILNGIWNYERRHDIIRNSLKSVGLFDRKNDKIKGYSGGMKQRLGIAKTLLHLPDILVVDEPTSGLDPKERIRFRNLLSEMGKKRIVIFSTHIVEDISSSCNKMAVLNKGEVVYEGKPYNLINKFEGKIWSSSLSEDKLKDLKQKAKLLSFNKIGELYKVKYYSEKMLDEFNPISEKPTLEDAYLALVH